MAKTDLRGKTISGTLWSAVERFAVQGVMFAVTIVMARLVEPSEFGLVAMLTVFIAVSQSLVDCGFSQALIRLQHRTQADNSTVFFFNIAVGLALYGALCAVAPTVARFYGQPQLSPILRVQGLCLVANSFVVVQRALLTVDVDFRTLAKASLAAAVISGVLGICLALAGMGVWALVWQQVGNAVAGAALIWGVARWRPSAVFSRQSFRSLFGFGSRLAAAGIIDTLYRQGWPMVIGKFFTPGILGCYNNAQTIANLPSSNLTGILQRVTYPVLCTIQDDEKRLTDAYRRFIRLSAFCVFPLMAGLSALSGPVVRVVLGPQWGEASPMLAIISLQMMWFPIHALNLNLLQVAGRSGVFLRLEIYKKIVGVAILCGTVPFGIIAMCWGGVATSLASLVINTSATGRLMGLGLWKQLRDMLPAMLYSLTMWGVAWGVTRLLDNDTVRLVCGVGAGAAWYAGISLMTHSADLRTLLSLVCRGKKTPASGAVSPRKGQEDKLTTDHE